MGCWGPRTHADKSAYADLAVWGDRPADVESVVEQLDTCAQAAATATGTAVRVERFLPYLDMVTIPG